MRDWCSYGPSELFADSLTDELQSDYCEVIEDVELAYEPVKQFAKSKHITVNNALVRLYRVHKVLASELTSGAVSAAQRRHRQNHILVLASVVNVPENIVGDVPDEICKPV